VAGGTEHEGGRKDKYEREFYEDQHTPIRRRYDFWIVLDLNEACFSRVIMQNVYVYCR
jgi:hypothetical protein